MLSSTYQEINGAEAAAESIAPDTTIEDKMVEDYKKLNDKCDMVITKINIRKKNKKNNKKS